MTPTFSAGTCAINCRESVLARSQKFVEFNFSITAEIFSGAFRDALARVQDMQKDVLRGHHLIEITRGPAIYGMLVPDFDFTSETSELLIELLTVTSVRKLDALTA